MSEQLGNWRDASRRPDRAVEVDLEQGQHPLEIREEKVVLVTEMRVEGRSPYAGPVQQVLDGDRIELLRPQQVDHRAAECAIGSFRASVERKVFGRMLIHDPEQMALVCSTGNVGLEVAGYDCTPLRADQMTTTDRPYGFALIFGTVAGLVTMANHPTGHALLADFERVALVNRAVHALAMSGTIATVFGLSGLRRHFENNRALVDAALISYAFGAVAVMFAAIASGLIGTEVARRVLEAGEAGRATWAPLQTYNFALNQATTQVFVVAASIGIVLWSVAMLGVPRFGRSLGILGIVIGLGAVVAILAGLRLDIHGFGAIVLGHGTWLVWTGIRLVRR
jgi:hypothetical protein